MPEITHFNYLLTLRLSSAVVLLLLRGLIVSDFPALSGRRRCSPALTFYPVNGESEAPSCQVQQRQTNWLDMSIISSHPSSSSSSSKPIIFFPVPETLIFLNLRGFFAVAHAGGGTSAAAASSPTSARSVSLSLSYFFFQMPFSLFFCCLIEFVRYRSLLGLGLQFEKQCKF